MIYRPAGPAVSILRESVSPALLRQVRLYFAGIGREILNRPFATVGHVTDNF